MSRPLLITDCDEVLLHMVAHFGAWLDEVHDVSFALDTHDFGSALTRRATGETIPQEEVWPLLEGFFDTEMHRQTLVPHAAEALGRIGEIADIVILTNLGDHRQEHRVAQLDALGIRHRVMTNQGGKGRPVSALIDEYKPNAAVFVDDLPVHHESVSRYVPEVWRLHMIAEPRLAPHIPPAPDAHARIDDWAEAVEWVIARLERGQPARRP
jgi:FMN phosphatase YigB (HAD superfamily)